jgi:hypothetical protein
MESLKEASLRARGEHAQLKLTAKDEHERKRCKIELVSTEVTETWALSPYQKSSWRVSIKTIVNGFCQVTPITMHHVFERLLTPLHPPRFGRLGSSFSLSVPSSYTQCSGPARPHHTSLDDNSKIQNPKLLWASQRIAASQLVDCV